MLGQPAPTELGPSGAFYAFEKGVEKTGGGNEFAEVLYKKHFIFEYKGHEKELGATYGQLLQYRASVVILMV